MNSNLKELLHKYNNQTAKEEEIELIKEKVEEFNLLQEQALKDESPLNQLELDFESVDTDKIKKQVNRKIGKLVLLIFTCLIGLLLTIFLVITPLMNHFYFNPNDKQKNATIPEFNLVSAVYTDLTQPYLRLAYVTSENTGPGSYQVEKGYSSALSTAQSNFSNPNFNYSIKRGKTIVTNEPPHNDTAPLLIHFESSSDDSMYEDFKTKRLEKIQALPDSSLLNVALSFKKPLSIKDTLTFLESETYPSASNYRLNWLSVSNTEDISLGIDWFGTFQILEDKVGRSDPYLLSLNKTYPNLFPGAPTHQEINNQSQALEDHFLSSLAYVTDNQDLLEKQESFYSPELLKKILTETKENGVKINGVYLSGTPKAINKFASKPEVANIDVHSTELYNDNFSDE